jgi:hypothetical protein
MDKQVIFSVANQHVEGCGKPPSIDNREPNGYRGYFENDYGEQAIFVYNRTTGEGTLYMGDAGWETPHRVLNGAIPNLILSPAERAWLDACWKAATRS